MHSLIIKVCPERSFRTKITLFCSITPGLAGKTNWETGLIDQYVDLVGDLFTEMIKSFFEKDETKKVNGH